MRRIPFLIIIVILVAILIGSISLYYFSMHSSTNLVKPCANSFNVGHYNLWADGSSSSCQFETTRNGSLTGAFHANASLDFFIQTDSEYQQTRIGSMPTTYLYELANTSTTNLNVSMPAGSYYIEFYFIFGYTCYNGSTHCGYTALNISQTFLVNLE
jgi:hypothetical protein